MIQSDYKGGGEVQDRNSRRLSAVWANLVRQA